jgi:hypothetical protein
MAGERVELSSHSGFHGTSTGTSLLTEVVDVVHFNYPLVLFVVFSVAFVANSVLSAEPSSESKEPVLLGPGGKPLPRSAARKSKEERDKKKKLKDFSRGRKLLFLYLSAGLLATFVANGVNIIVHALTKSEKHWWCGKATAVSGIEYTIFQNLMLILLNSADIRLCFGLLLQHLPHLAG